VKSPLPHQLARRDTDEYNEAITSTLPTEEENINNLDLKGLVTVRF